MTDRIEIAGLRIARELHEFVATEALPGTGIEADAFWNGFSAVVHDLAPKNRALLAKRDAIQEQIDGWYRDHGAPVDMEAYKGFLKEIGYLVPEGPAFSVSTDNVDPEIADVAGPQLVVPVMNARYALNAANARWGSLYDALYGTDAIPETDGAEKGKAFNPARGAKVVAWTKTFLDEAAPLTSGKWAGVNGLSLAQGALRLSAGAGSTTLADPRQFVGYRGDAANPDAVLLVRNGLHIEIVIDRNNQIGRTDPAGIADVILESALTTIQDCEDSVAA
ncbi:malate synthase G, partial [Mesorhizobium sp. M7A.F.Ca.CA.001.12.2.1]